MPNARTYNVRLPDGSADVIKADSYHTRDGELQFFTAEGEEDERSTATYAKDHWTGVWEDES